MLISAVINILDDFGSLLPARSVTVKPSIQDFTNVFESFFMATSLLSRRFCKFNAILVINILTNLINSDSLYRRVHRPHTVNLAIVFGKNTIILYLEVINSLTAIEIILTSDSLYDICDTSYMI